MTVKTIQKNTESLSMTISTEYRAPIARVWQLWQDPRQLERWWGPPTYPATVVDHDFVPGGRVSYFMTGPEGDRHWGWWRIIAIESPTLLEVEDGFGDDTGKPDPDMPMTRMRVELFEEPDGVTHMSIETKFPSVEAMQQMIEMGLEEGIALSLGQIDDLLGDSGSG